MAENGATKDKEIADHSMGAALSASKTADAEDTALLSEQQVGEINKLKPANLPKLDLSKDFYQVFGMGKTKFMPSPECWAKIRLIFKISITEGHKEVLDYDGNSYYSYQARGYRLVGGEKVFGVGTKTINFAAKEAEKKIAAEEKLEKKYFKSQAEADRWRQKEIIRIRNFGMEMCETGAINRLTRGLTGFASGIADDAEKKLLVSEATDVAAIVGGSESIPTDKSRAMSTLFMKVGELGLNSEDVSAAIKKKRGVDKLTTLTTKVIQTEARGDLKKLVAEFLAAKGGKNGAAPKAKG